MFPENAKKLDSGVYMVQSTGNVFASNESMKSKVDRKAESIC